MDHNLLSIVPTSYIRQLVAYQTEFRYGSAPQLLTMAQMHV